MSNNEEVPALDGQVGGNHYKDMAIQPVEFIEKNGLGFLEGCVIKRMCRWRKKNGIEDLEKAKHEIDLLIQMHVEEHDVLPHPGANPEEVRCVDCGCAWNEPHRPSCVFATIADRF